ncbi:MAG: phosphatidylcholine and lysophosphatidylcholine phospholipase [Bathelium mastoideum]|nr:MAG: phosphatidylcholine and lysophosphatidylcholine phospholipase [Bathelium mastoideum]
MAFFTLHTTFAFVPILEMYASCVEASGASVAVGEPTSFNTLAEVAATTTSAAVQRITEGAASLGPIGRTIVITLRFIPTALFWLISFATITLPTWIFTVLSMSLTFTMNMTTLLLILVAFASTVSWIVRYRFLDMYSHLPPEPQRKEPQIDVFPESQEGDSKPGLSNYLDEFLSAIKVFGYLERHVFHELTRTMQTRKLIAGETLLLEEEKGFCLVVDGLVQIFVKSNRRGDDEGREINTPGEESQEDEASQRDGDQGYQLLTEVKNGAPMSSLFSILALFTEDVKLRHEPHESASLESEPNTATLNHLKPGVHASAAAGTPVTPDSGATSPVIAPLTSTYKHGNRLRRPSTLTRPTSAGRLSNIPPLDLDVEPEEYHHEKHYQYSRPKRAKSAHPDIVARATTDTTIAIIPATAFHRLTRVYPKATAHIIQVILTRFQRVTLATGSAYLGLTSEVLRTEKLMNRYTTYELPGFLRGSALERLKTKFQTERARIGREEGMKGIALHNNSAGQPRRWSSGLRREATTQAQQLAMLRRAPPSTDSMQHPPASVVERNGTNGVSAGDLLTNAYPGRSGIRQGRVSFSQPADNLSSSQREAFGPLEQESPIHYASPVRPSMHMHRQESMDEDMQFRESILECIFKAIGFTSQKNSIRKPVSVEQSPRLVSYDSRRQKAVFNNAFGLMEPYEVSGDGETDSITSTSITTASMSAPTNLVEELRNEIEIVYFPKDAILVEQGERNPGLYYVIDGFLDVSVPMDEHDVDSNVFGTSPQAPDMTALELFAEQQYKVPVPPSGRSSAGVNETKKKKPAGRKSLFTTKPGGLVGYLGTVSSHRSFIDVTAKTDVYVGFLPRVIIERIVDRSPIVLLTMAKRLTTLLPRIILHIDFALEWVQVSAGQAIYHQDDESDAIYIVLNGRLRAIQEGPNETVKVTGEYGQGDSVGELEVLTETARSSTLHAIRDTEMARLPRTLFNSLAMEHPGITMKISKIIASKMRKLVEDPLRDVGRERTAAVQTIKASSTVNLRTVAIIPVTAGVPVVEFGSRLLNALTQIGIPNGITSLNQAAILNHLGRHAFSRMGKLKLSQYLADLEDKYGLVLYVTDTPVKSPWTQTCISQADCILLVGLAEGSPSIGEYERFLLTTKTTARKELVLLHAERYCPSGLTRRWLRNRVWINGSHHHIQMPYRSTPEPVHPPERQFGSALKKRVQTIQAEIQKYTSRKLRQTPLYSAESPFKGDFHRLARRLCGKSVGLVLGGGGARGIAHVGILRALEEAGIPIDIVGGTSIGAFIGALYAWDADVVPMYGRAKKFSGRMGSFWRLALDITYPSVSYTTGHEFNRGLFKTLGNAQIEDFWLEFYCNTTNISKSRCEIHTSGYVWRYVRASMTLAGLLPPLCDEGNMLLDGGYVDNLTVQHMKSLGADVIFAVDVGALDDNTPQTYGDSLSGFWATLNRWNPFSSHPNPPTLQEIQGRLAYVSSVDALERAKTTPGCRYMRPPVDPYGTLAFDKFEEIDQVGYQYGKQYLAQLKAEGVLPVMEETEEKKNLRRTMAPRRASI